jgi:transposase
LSRLKGRRKVVLPEPERSRITAATILEDWINRVWGSGIPMLIKMGKALAIYHRGILAFYDYPISTGFLEGTNNKSKTIAFAINSFRLEVLKSP